MTHVVGIFPDEAAAERLIGAILLAQSDEWTIGNRCMPHEALRGLLAASISWIGSMVS